MLKIALKQYLTLTRIFHFMLELRDARFEQIQFVIPICLRSSFLKLLSDGSSEWHVHPQRSSSGISISPEQPQSGQSYICVGQQAAQPSQFESDLQ
jgi:hypothetical protein